MKLSLIILISCITLSYPFWNNQGSIEKYCASLKDGVMVLTKDGMIVTSDVKINDSITVTTDGVVIKKDGTRTPLKDGECITAGTEKNKTEDKKNKFPK